MIACDEKANQTAGNRRRSHVLILPAVEKGYCLQQETSDSD
jgi:hypothetical protein